MGSDACSRPHIIDNVVIVFIVGHPSQTGILERIARWRMHKFEVSESGASSHHLFRLLPSLLPFSSLSVHAFVRGLHIELKHALIPQLPFLFQALLTFEVFVGGNGSLLVLVACRHSKEHSFNTALTLMEINNGVRSLEFFNLPDQVVLLQLNLTLI